MLTGELGRQALRRHDRSVPVFSAGGPSLRGVRSSSPTFLSLARPFQVPALREGSLGQGGLVDFAVLKQDPLASFKSVNMRWKCRRVPMVQAVGGVWWTWKPEPLQQLRPVSNRPGSVTQRKGSPPLDAYICGLMHATTHGGSTTSRLSRYYLLILWADSFAIDGNR
ncbi:hypothetical protein BO78DRAFT_41958 [Aspergillus sclerotiicarbonarius CBS 121057]|uniref:Uncharacterized protein n=1 Tax=Aspergillus sclerotiicarbonarius (strain CBS 121057 / IBT 28362) TaxID=1448318 RepID=A0A319E1V9_ASPSB|nr:hypothetical protein BO78DRAFT_41958 [Aspergillus sclerotiicarbonarius CBS 121057]